MEQRNSSASQGRPFSVDRGQSLQGGQRFQGDRLNRASVLRCPSPSKRPQKSYVCIDLKSFYASVECVDRGMDPMTENLVVADPTRCSGTICLAITPAMKALGVKNRCRVFQIPKGIDYVMAMPRMARYMEVSARINAIYLRYVSPDDVHVYSIDECFIDVTPYLRLYGMTAREMAAFLRQKVFDETGITATAGVGTNLFLAKVALDIGAKHAPDGIGVLDEQSYREKIWFHQPITDIWQVGPGIQRRLARRGIVDMAGVCATDPTWIKKEFGKSGDYLLDHAWGLEPCTIADIKAYRPVSHSISNGQVLARAYSFDEARTVLREMVDAVCLDLCAKGLSCNSVSVRIGLVWDEGMGESCCFGTGADSDGLGVGRSAVGSVGLSDGSVSAGAAGSSTSDEPGRSNKFFQGFFVGGSNKFDQRTTSSRKVMERALLIFDQRVPADSKIKRLSVALGGLASAGCEQLSLFDVKEEEREESLARSAVAIREKFGKNALLKGTSLKEEATMRERNLQIGGHRA